MPTMVASMLSVTICFLMSQIPRAIRFSIESLYFSPDHDKRLIGAVEITESLSNFLTPFSMLITGAAFRATLWRLLKCRTSGAWLITSCHGDALHHDDVIKWKHFPRYWPFVQGIHRSPVTQRPMTRGFDVFLGNGWVNNREAGDLRRYCAHYDVTVMLLLALCEGIQLIANGYPSQRGGNAEVSVFRCCGCYQEHAIRLTFKHRDTQATSL